MFFVPKKKEKSNEKKGFDLQPILKPLLSLKKPSAASAARRFALRNKKIEKIAFEPDLPRFAPICPDLPRFAPETRCRVQYSGQKICGRANDFAQGACYRYPAPPFRGLGPPAPPIFFFIRKTAEKRGKIARSLCISAKM